MAIGLFLSPVLLYIIVIFLKRVWLCTLFHNPVHLIVIVVESTVLDH